MFPKQLILLVSLCAYFVSAEQHPQQPELLAENSVKEILGAPHLKAANCSVFFGRRDYKNTLVYQAVVEKPYKYFSKVTEIVKFPENNHINHRPITFMAILDRKAKGSCGTIKITSGGISATSVVLKLESLRGHGLHFWVQIYTQ